MFGDDLQGTVRATSTAAVETGFKLPFAHTGKQRISHSDGLRVQAAYVIGAASGVTPVRAAGSS